MALPTGLSNALLIPVCGGRPVLQTQEETISTPPALAPVAVGPEDRRAQQDLQEVAESEVVRPVLDQVVAGVAAATVRAAV